MEKCPHCPYETLKKITLYRHIKLEHKKENQDKSYCMYYGKPGDDYYDPNDMYGLCIYCVTTHRDKEAYDKHILTDKHIKTKFLEYTWLCHICRDDECEFMNKHKHIQTGLYHVQTFMYCFAHFHPGV
jgi:hypoxanthine phosphoribosyltransferase